MPRAYLSVGSNIDAEQNIRSAVQALRDAFGELMLSPTYKNAPVGFAGDDFYNLVIAFDTDLPVQQVAAILRRIEADNGRTRQESRFSSRTLDLDLLLYGELVEQGEGYHVPRDEISRYGFVLVPLYDIAPQLMHPTLKKRITQLYHDQIANLPPMQKINISY